MGTLEAIREEIRPRVLPGALPADLEAAVAGLLARAGDSLAGVVFFGSRKTRASPDDYSAYDFFVAVRDYGDFYRALAQTQAVRRGPRLLAALNRVLPPNQVSVAAGPGGAVAKCAVVTMDALERETSRRRHDHFVLGRLFQPTWIVHAPDAGFRERLLTALASAHALTYQWGRPFFPERFDVADYCRTLLRVSFAAEVRPEPEGRADALWSAQESYLSPVYGRLLRELLAAGEIEEAAPGAYRLRRPVGLVERVRTQAYFRWSLVRATVRWAKHMVTFEGWLDFIVRKARRHTGEDIVLTPRERRAPLIFLWPRFIRYLRGRNRGRGGTKS